VTIDKNYGSNFQSYKHKQTIYLYNRTMNNFQPLSIGMQYSNNESPLHNFYKTITQHVE